MEFLHRRGVRGYVTFNTSSSPSELADAADCLRAIIAAGVDAAIVAGYRHAAGSSAPLAGFSHPLLDADDDHQRRRRGLCPILSSAQLLVVLGSRELPSPTLPRSTPPSPPPKCNCCLRSLSMARSVSLTPASASRANRSVAGPPTAASVPKPAVCPADLISDGKQVPLGDRRYLLSPGKDLSSGLDVLLRPRARRRVALAQDREAA